MHKEKTFKFSIVTAVYNVAEYIDTLIKSIVNQDIGFRENIELILVDDGSSDKSGSLIDKWAAKYPENIIAIHKKNSGVSSARNAGLKIAHGEILNFADGDDKFEKTAFRRVMDFFEHHGNETDVAAIPIIYFDLSHGNHLLNGKFSKGTRVVDLEAEPESIHIHANSSFIKREIALAQNFDEKMPFCEDSKFLIEAVLKRKKLGVICRTCYYYRRRYSSNNQSAVQSKATNKIWYLPIVEMYYAKLIEKCLKEEGKVPKFLQNIFACDIMWREEEKIPPVEILGAPEAEKYYKALKNVLEYVDGEVIVSRREFPWRSKFDILKLKYSASARIVKNGDLFSIVYDDGLKINLEELIKPNFEVSAFGAADLKCKAIVFSDESLASLDTIVEIFSNGKWVKLAENSQESKRYDLNIPYWKIFGKKKSISLRTGFTFGDFRYFTAEQNYSYKGAILRYFEKKLKDAARFTLGLYKKSVANIQALA